MNNVEAQKIGGEEEVKECIKGVRMGLRGYEYETISNRAS